MEDCFICTLQVSTWKVLKCQHKLCFLCYLKLTKSLCPFCRQIFTYTSEEIKIKQEYIKNSIMQPPQITQYNQNSSTSVINNILNNNIPFSRLHRNKKRRRRRNLTFKEISEKRKIIRKRCKRKWMKKNGALRKIKWWQY